MPHCFCVCFTVFWLCLLLLLSICHKQTCFPFRCKWPLRLFVFVVAIFCFSFHLPFAYFLLISFYCFAGFHPHCFICCSLFALSAPLSPSPSAECFIGLLFESQHNPPLWRCSVCPQAIFQITICFLIYLSVCLKVLYVLQWKQMLHSHLPLVSRQVL